MRSGGPSPACGESSSARDASEAGPARSSASSLTACWSSVPRSLRTDDAGCGSPPEECATTRSAVSSSARSWFSSSATRARTIGSSIRSRGVGLEGRERPLGGADRGDADALVAEQELGDRPALAGLADQQVAGHADVGEPHLVDLVAAVDQLDRPDLDAGGGHVDEEHRDAGLLLHLGVGAHEGEDPVAVLAERGPGLLPVDDPVVAVAHRGRAQAGEVGAGVGLGEALRPPDVEVGGVGRKRFFCSSVPNWAMTGPIIEALNASGIGTPARCISSCHRCRWRSVQSWPPHSSGQCGTARPSALSSAGSPRSGRG